MQATVSTMRPVLANADVGVAMGGLGADAAMEAADVVIMSDEPSKIALGMRISQKTMTIGAGKYCLFHRGEADHSGSEHCDRDPAVAGGVCRRGRLYAGYFEYPARHANLKEKGASPQPGGIDCRKGRGPNAFAAIQPPGGGFLRPSVGLRTKPDVL